jgi:hypothetical protein
MAQPTATPPALAARVLSGLLPEFSREAILGDMQETFAQLEREKGRGAANRWYWQEALTALPGFAWHAISTTQFRRQFVSANILSDNWFGKQNGLTAAIGLLLLLPALLVEVFAVVYVTAGKNVVAFLNSTSWSARLLHSMETGFIELGGVSLPVGILMLGAIALAAGINVLAVTQIKFTPKKDALVHAEVTVQRKLLNMLLLVLVAVMLLGMDWLIS